VLSVYRKKYREKMAREYPGWFDATHDEQVTHLRRLERDAFLLDKADVALQFAEMARNRREARQRAELAYILNGRGV
jgi:hypothetical protein